MLSCINCKKDVEPEEGKLFAQVFVCPDCFKVAETIHRRAKKELEQYMMLLEEMIRTSLIAGSLSLKTKEGSNIMRTVEGMKAAMEKGGAIPSECKKESTPPHVRTLAALGESSSGRHSPQGTR